MYAPPRGGGGGGGVGGPVGGGGGVNSGGSGGVNPYWPPPGGVGPDACQVYGCKQVANLDAGSDWVWVPSGGSRTGSLPGGTTCSPVAMGGLAEITCTSSPTQGYTSGNTGGDWVRVNRPPIQVIWCTLGFNCSDESTGSDEGGASKAEVLTSDEEGGAKGPPSLGDAAASTPREQAVNPRGEPYPITIDPRTSQPIPFPENEMTWTAKDDRVDWNSDLRGAFIKEWIDRGYPDYGKAGWDALDIHHILPKAWGGTNDFWNLVPVDRVWHQQEISPWWSAFRP